MQRRGFLSAILGAAATPAIVSASSLMKIVPVKPETLIYKATGRYDLTYVKEGNSLIFTRPTKLFVPAMMFDQALKILDAEFAKEYTLYARRNK